MRRFLTFVVVVFFLMAVAANGWAKDKRPQGRKFRHLRVMTLNFYIGADILNVNEPSPCGALQSVHELYEDILASEPEERAEAHADVIFKKRPHVIALQEMYRISEQVPSTSLVCDNAGNCTFADFVPNLDEDGNVTSITFNTNAETLVYDYLDLLLEALADRGLYYDVVEDALAYESDFEFPSWDLEFDPELDRCVPVDGALPTDIRAEDRDVILVQSDIIKDDQTLKNGTTANYKVLAPFDIQTESGPSVRIISVRGYGATDLTFRGRTYRIVNTHLEVDDQSDPKAGLNLVQAAQAKELVYVLSDEKLPLVVAGDFNSSPDPADVSRAYEIMAKGGFKDLWARFKRRPGYTCCQSGDLLNFESELYKRIDLIYVRDSKETRFLPSPMQVTGNRQSDKTDSGLWPSDHASVAAKIRSKSKGRYKFSD